MRSFVNLLQCQVSLVFSLKIAYGEHPPNLLPHHVLLNMLWIQTVFELVSFWVRPPMTHLIKLTMSCIGH
jgi:hypothetical protein